MSTIIALLAIDRVVALFIALLVISELSCLKEDTRKVWARFAWGNITLGISLSVVIFLLWRSAVMVTTGAPEVVASLRSSWREAFPKAPPKVSLPEAKVVSEDKRA